MKRKPIKPMKYPLGQEYAYRRILLSLTNTYKKLLKQHMSPHVISMATEATAFHLPTGEIVRQDAGWEDELRKVMLQITKDMVGPTNSAIRQMNVIGPQVNQYNKAQWTSLVRSQYAIDPILKEDKERYKFIMENWSRSNSLLIKDIPFKTSNQIATMTRQALIDGTNLKDVTNEVFNIMAERTDVSDSRAKLIARDQVSKLNGQLTKERQTDLGVEGYIWTTVGDERVRDTHEDNDGKYFTWDDPPAETGHPGEDYQCRCWAEPVLPEFVAFEASLLEEAE